jgi:hypothetical protein
LFGFFGQLRIEKDNGFKEISEQKIIYSETREHVLTPFFGKKTCKKGEAADEKQSIIGRLKREKGWSIGPADSQRSSTLQTD